MKTLTIEEAKALISSGHVVHAYPRKQQVCVDGFKYFAASKAVCAAIKALNA